MTDTPSKQPDPAEEVAVAPPCAMVIFGAAGDLTRRLVVPALYNLINAGRLPNEFRLVGIDLWIAALIVDGALQPAAATNTARFTLR